MQALFRSVYIALVPLSKANHRENMPSSEKIQEKTTQNSGGLTRHMDFPGSSESKKSACSAGDSGLIPGSGRSPGEENGNPLQYSCLENPGGAMGLQRVRHD